jgi:hypothetical protein
MEKEHLKGLTKYGTKQFNDKNVYWWNQLVQR